MPVRVFVAPRLSSKTRAKVCLVVAAVWYVENAFNSANWKRIKGVFNDSSIPENLTGAYLPKRALWFEANEGPKQYVLTAGVPKDSLLDLLLWKVMCNGTLTLPVAEDAAIVGFADDLFTVIAVRRMWRSTRRR